MIFVFSVLPVFGSVTEAWLSLRSLVFVLPPNPLTLLRFGSPSVVSAGKLPASYLRFTR